jgi:hypothetical protein
MVHPNDDFLSAPELDYEGFRAALREDWGGFSPALQTNIFVGKVGTRRVSGFVATDLTCNATRIERTELDIRRNQQAHGLMSDWPNYPAGAADGRDLGSQSSRRSRDSCKAPTEPQDALQVCGPHLDLLALTPRLLEALGAGNDRATSRACLRMSRGDLA